MEDETAGGLLLVTFIAIGILVIIGLLHINDDYDDVNTRILGSIICEEQGLEYQGREFKIIEYKGVAYKSVPTIYCTNRNNEKIIDGIVIKR